jgi:hypothetical protein
MLLPEVEKALEELRASFPGCSVLIEEDGGGGARVLVEGAGLNEKYAQADTWLAGHVPAQIPYADVYPLFIRGDLSRRDGRPLGEAMAAGQTFMGRMAVQVSRRSNARDPKVETPAMKFLKVLAWVNSRP